MTEALAELERVARYAQTTAKLLPKWAPRPLMPWEVKASVNFVEVDASLQRGYTRTADILAELQRALVTSLAAALDGASDGKVIAARVAAWVQDPPENVAQAKAQAKADMQAVLVDCANRSGDQLRRSAALQGVAPASTVKAAAGEADPAVLVDEAALPVEALAGQVTQAAVMASQRPSSPDAPVTAADNTSTAGAEDLARQGVHIAAGEGRSAAADELPAPSEIYASELLDGATCDPCSAIDGTQYDTVDDAETDYPGQGPYVDCDGGARCRGTLVLVWGETAAVDQPAPPDAATVEEPAPPEEPTPVAPKPTPIPPEVPVAPQAQPQAQVSPPMALDLTAKAIRLLSDTDLEAALTQAFEQDHPVADQLVAEMDRREAAPLLEAQQKALRAEAAKAKRSAAKEEQWTEVQRRIDAGEDPRSAVADVTGVSIEKQLQTELFQRLKSEGTVGGTLDQMVTYRYKQEIARQYVDAEDVTRGHMLTRQGEARGIDPAALFNGPEARARKWASDELKQYWDQNGRLTLDSYKQQLLTGTASGEEAIVDFLQ